MKNEFKLIEEIIRLSENKIWDKAKDEWKPIYVFDEPENTCLCSHYPITENIIIENKINHNKTIIGNCCIKKFFGIKDYSKFFKALKQNRINKIIIDISYEKKIINKWEKQFMNDTWRKKKLFSKQILKFNEIKEKIFKKLKESDNYEKRS